MHTKTPRPAKSCKKSGMTYEGTMRQTEKTNGGLFDKVNYAILADDYLNNHTK